MARTHPRVKLSDPTPPTPGAMPPPAPRRNSRARYDWDEVRARLEANPGLWILAAPDVALGTYYYVSRGNLTHFDGMGGYLEATMRGQKPVRGKKTSEGALWLRWEPEGWTDEDQARAEATAAAGEAQL